MRGDLSGVLAIALDPGYIEAYTSLAIMMYLKGDKAGACDQLKPAISRGSYMAEELSDRFCK